ncbi:MAG: transglycosylase domain-containing protein [Prevotella sp.]|nr:transglycosylase domain-containing protein [Bacteroides sp.]MCM1366156.1 transglycosylase domain-containing protein [Prevotella sp.]MCM1436779.1 transglycosylase domain-containing protein [Prevotella sp.]
MTDRRNRYDDNDAFAPRSGRKTKRNMTVIKWLWIAFLAMGFAIFVIFLLIYNGVIGYMPPIEEIEDPHNSQASVVYASDGTTELGRYFISSGNRVPVDFDSISQNVIDALIATEDVRFKEHSGIDFMALGRTAVKTLMLRDKSSGGGSTITQQLAKQLYSQPSQNILKRAMQKPIEWMIAIKLERFYTKEEIITMYLNRFDFLNNAIGIKTAAFTYYGKRPDQLTVPEAATLIGMLKNPSYFNPLRYEERTLNRRNTVIDQMVKAGYLSESDANIYKSQPLGITFHKMDRKEGGAPYFRDYIRYMLLAKKPERPRRDDYKSTNSWNVALSNYKHDSVAWEDNPVYGWIEKNPKPDGSTYDLYEDGLKIYSTLDLRMQSYAEDAVYQHVGGTLQPMFNSERSHSKYWPYSASSGDINASGLQRLIRNAIKQTYRYRMMKQAGCSDSEIEKAFHTPERMVLFAYERKAGKLVPGTVEKTMTPYDSLLYMKSILRCGMMAMDPVNGYIKAYVGGPDFSHFQYDMVSRARRQVGSTAKPLLYGSAMDQGETPCSVVGGLTLKGALTASNNNTSLRLINKTGIAHFAQQTLPLFGISGLLPANQTLALGSFEASVKDMVGAYSAFANKGLRVDPVFITRIEDNQGNIIYSATPHRTEVLSETAFYQSIDMMMSVVNNGTGRRIREYGVTAQMGGKTGTTNDNSDAWFIGVLPELIAGAWVGGEERYIHFLNGSIGQGAGQALPIIGMFLKKIFDDPKLPYSQDTKFKFPDGFKFCGGGDWGGGGGASTAVDEPVVEAVEGVFD